MYFSSGAFEKKKKTTLSTFITKSEEKDRGQLQRARILIKKNKKQEILKKTAIQENYSYIQQVIGRDQGGW